MGSEVKSIRTGRLNMDESFVRLKDQEAWWINAFIASYQATGKASTYDPRRSRKLLLHHQELLRLSQKVKEKGLTLVPVSCYTKAGKIKLQIALAKGKKQYEKREAKKEQDLEREILQENKLKGTI